MYMTSYFWAILGAILCLGSSFYVKHMYKKYSSVFCLSGMTGAEAALRILSQNGVSDVTVNRVAGTLTDHYNPGKKEVNLSEDVYEGTSVAAIAVAAHECGHVMQHHNGYFPLSLRTAILPLANLGSKLGLPMVLIGVFLGSRFNEAYANGMQTGTMDFGWLLVNIGLWAFGLAVAFQIVTLPVEFNASIRALHMLDEYGILGSSEINDGRKVLWAAALTYVAAAASSILQFLRLLAISKGGRRRR